MKYLNDISYNDCVGKVFKSKSSGDFKVVKYSDSGHVEIRFLNTGYETVVQLGHIKSGGVKDRYSPSVYGVGITGTKHPTYECGVQTKEYVLWNGMLESECHKTSFSNIAIEITKCSNSSYFSSNGAGLVVTVKNLGCENRKVKHLFDKE